MEYLHSEWTEGVKAAESTKEDEAENSLRRDNPKSRTEKSKLHNSSQDKTNQEEIEKTKEKYEDFTESKWNEEVESAVEEQPKKDQPGEEKSISKKEHHQKRNSYLERAYKKPPKKKVEITEPSKSSDDNDENLQEQDQTENLDEGDGNKKKEYKIEEHHNLSEDTQGHVVNIVAGSLSGVIATALSLPLELMRRQAQLLDKVKLRRPVWQEIRVLYAEKGLAGFWKGHTRAQILGVCHNIAIFWTHEQVEKALDKIPALDNYDMLKDFAAGFCSGASTTLIVFPVEQIISRIVVVKRLRERFRLVDLRPILKVDFSHMFHRGILPDALQHSFNYGYKFLFYNMICDHVFAKTVDQERDDIPSERLLLAGATSGLLSHMFTYPFDTLRHRLQIPPLKRQTFQFERSCRRLLQCLHLVVRTDGFCGLYRGILPVLLKTTVNTSVMFAVFDKVYKIMNKEI